MVSKDTAPAPTDGPASLADWVAKHTHAPVITGVSQSHLRGVPTFVPVALVPNGAGGFDLESVKRHFDEYRFRPERMQGTANLYDLPSFIGHVKRFQTSNSTLFADSDRNTPSLTAVLDYNHARNIEVDGTATDPVKVTDAAGEPAFGTHRALYKFPLSDEWKAWTEKDGKAMGQEAFAEFIEDRIADVDLPPDDEVTEKLRATIGGSFASPSRLMELSRGLKVHVNHNYKGVTNLSSGEMQFAWSEEHRNEAGEPLVVPGLFFIAIPVFLAGARFGLMARLRYRLANSKCVWWYQLYRAQETFDVAVREAAAEAAQATGLPLFYGRPE